MKLLTICIPTYNRSSHAIRQLEYLKKEINGYEDCISIIVADNQSEIKHQKTLINYHSENCFFDLKLNDTNLGIVGNLYYLNSISNSQYIWFIGDDDILIEGLLEKIYPILKRDKNCYIFLNHVGIRNEPNNIVMKMDLSNYEAYYKDGKTIAIDIFCKYGGVLMFITANIYPLNHIKEISECERCSNMADPLLFSLYSAAKSSIYLIKDIFILDQYANISWINEIKNVHLRDIPSIICELNKFGYTKNEVNQLLFNYFKSKRCIIHFLRYSDQELKSNTMFFLGYWNILKLCITNLFFTIYNKIKRLASIMK
jgi:hypothetical protein